MSCDMPFVDSTISYIYHYDYSCKISDKSNNAIYIELSVKSNNTL